MSELLDLAARTAREAGSLLREAFARDDLEVESKSTPTDLVSEADTAAEALIRERLLAARPEDGILGEEGGDVEGPSGLRWVVDPLDGTVNFLFGIPQWAVSIAVEDGDGTLAGVVYDPMRDELWSAERDGPPRLDARPVRGSTQTDLAQAMVATGFAYGAEARAVQGEMVARLLPRVRDIRRAGAAALDLAWVAGGRYDVFFERGLNAWDRAAGALLCVRAGLEVVDLAPVGPTGAGVLVAPPTLVEPLLELVGPAA
jgi:myo-inositol-1(or 4)-monophosphatase